SRGSPCSATGCRSCCSPSTSGRSPTATIAGASSSSRSCCSWASRSPGAELEIGCHGHVEIAAPVHLLLREAGDLRRESLTPQVTRFFEEQVDGRGDFNVA